MYKNFPSFMWVYCSANCINTAFITWLLT